MAAHQGSNLNLLRKPRAINPGSTDPSALAECYALHHALNGCQGRGIAHALMASTVLPRSMM